jgi:2-polyprenyl-3-methyl-5-hydroxy-6-metoxy-1,4-benzoquinol methylase
MARPFHHRSQPYLTALAAHRRLQAEVDAAAAGPEEPRVQTFLRYYHKIRSRPALRPFYEHNWADRLQTVVAAIDRPGMRVLDAGCGVGTESLLFAGLGAEVTAVDLHPPRIAAARLRAEAAGAAGSRIELICSDISRVVRPGEYDIVWSMESVSHIDPLEGFVRLMRENLRPGGLLIVSDANGLNPWLQIAALRARGLRVYEHRRDEATGESVRYANERLVPVTSLRRLMRRCGLTVESTHLSGFFPPPLFARSPLGSIRCEEVIRAVPALPLFAGIYTVAARR